MDIGLAHTLAGACSLGALYNLGQAFVGFNSNTTANNEDEILDQDLSKLTNKTDELPDEEPLSPEETQELINSLEMNAYLKGMLTASNFKSDSGRIQSLVYAIGLGSIAYLLLQNQSQSDQVQMLSNQIGQCEAKIHPHTIQRLQLDSIKPHPDGFFFGEVAYRVINFMNRLPIISECLKKGETPKENCKYMPVKISNEDVCIQFCADTEIDLENQNTLKFEATPLNVPEHLQDLAGLVKLSIVEQFKYDEGQLTVTSQANGSFKGKRITDYSSIETIIAKASAQPTDSPSSVGVYTAEETAGTNKNKQEKRYVLGDPGNLDIKPFDDQAFPALNEYLANPAPTTVEDYLTKS